MSADSNLILMHRFAEAWNAHDVDALLACMMPDAQYFAAAGKETGRGERFSGRAELRVAFASIWERIPDAAWQDATHFVSGDRGVSEWRFTGTGKDGTRIDVAGCDVFTFQGGLISIKDTFRKSTT